MRKKHLNWTFVYVPPCGAKITPYDPENGGCDYIVNVSRDGHCKDYAASCNGCGPPRWLSDKACGCDCGKCPGFPVAPLPAGATFGADPKVFPYPFPGDTAQHDYSIEDALKVPADLEPGEYVVGYRWDCEATSRAHTTALLPTVLGHPKLSCAHFHASCRGVEHLQRHHRRVGIPTIPWPRGRFV